MYLLRPCRISDNKLVTLGFLFKLSVLFDKEQNFVGLQDWSVGRFVYEEEKILGMS